MVLWDVWTCRIHPRAPVPDRQGRWLAVSKVTLAPTFSRIAIVALMLLGGCSASARIAERASDIRHLADSIISRTDQKDFTSQDVESIRSDAEAIRGLVDDIHSSLPGVTDVVPWWSSIIRYGLLCAIVIGVVYVLHASGALVALRIAVGWIPRKTRTDADMLRSVLDDAKPETIREYVAMRRGSDPAFSRAFDDAKAGV